MKPGDWVVHGVNRAILLTVVEVESFTGEDGGTVALVRSMDGEVSGWCDVSMLQHAGPRAELIEVGEEES